jgi:hypothetical protein
MRRARADWSPHQRAACCLCIVVCGCVLCATHQHFERASALSKTFSPLTPCCPQVADGRCGSRCIRPAPPSLPAFTPQPDLCTLCSRTHFCRILGVGAPNQSNKTDLALAARSEVASSARVFWFGGALGVLVWRGGWVSAGVGLAVWMCGWVAWCGRAGRGPSRPAAVRSGRRGGFARLQGLFRVLWGVAGGGRMRAFPD